MARAVYDEDNQELPYCLKITRYIKKMIPLLPESNNLNELYWNVLLWEAPNLFESFLLYMEKNRYQRKKFYEPRSNTLKIVVDDLQDLEDGVMDFHFHLVLESLRFAFSFLHGLLEEIQIYITQWVVTQVYLQKVSIKNS